MTPRVRFTVRRLMVVVAAAAVLLSFPRGVMVPVFAAVFALGVWVPITILSVHLTDGLWERTAPAVPIFVAVVGGSSLLLSSLALLVRESALGVVFFGLTPVNLAGPFYAARRIYHDQPLAAGEILWGWLGVFWSVLLGIWHPHSLHDVLFMMGEGARLTLVGAVLLALYGGRPCRPQPAWAHHLGWALLECDVIVWGWYAAGFLRWK